MRAAASSTATTPNGASPRTPTSSNGCSSSAPRCRASAGASPRTSPAPVGSRPRRETVLATIVRLLDTTYVRIGNEEYARENKSFGLTTLRNRHAAVSGRSPAPALSRQERQGARGRARRSARRPRRPPLPGDAGPGPVPVRRRGQAARTASARPTSTTTSARSSGADFTAKDFRTWHGTAHALALWIERGGRQRRAAEREGAARRGRQAARQHGRGLQEVVRASARSRGAGRRPSTTSCSPSSTSARRRARPERRRAAPARVPLAPLTAAAFGGLAAVPPRRATLYLPVGRRCSRRPAGQETAWKSLSFVSAARAASAPSRSIARRR